MSTFVRAFAPVAAALAVAYTACFAWPARAHAQQRAADASSASAPRPGADDQYTRDDADLPAATRRARADERRLLGGPRPTFDPYVNDDPSPGAQEDALMSEQRMTIVSPSAFYSSRSAALDGSAGGTTGRRRPTAAATPPDGSAASPQRYGYRTGGTSADIYRNPYRMPDPSVGQPYRSPW